MNSKLKDAIEIAIGFLSAFALFGAIGMIMLGVIGAFDQGTRYNYPQCGSMFASCERAGR